MGTEYLINLSDGILLERIQNGDDDAFVALIEKYERLLKTIIHYEIHNAEEEADIYSETRFAIVRRIPRRSDDIESVEHRLKQTMMLTLTKKDNVVFGSITCRNASLKSERSLRKWVPFM